MLRAIALSLALAAAVAAAADPAGKWNVIAKRASGRELKIDLLLKNDGSKWSGSITGPQGSLDLQDVQLSGDQLTYKLQFDEGIIANKLTVGDDSMTGTATMPDGGSFALTATRAVNICGKWKVTAMASDREHQLTLDLSENAGKITGTLTGEGEPLSIQDARFENNQLTFKITVDSGVYNVKVDLAGRVFKGTFTGAAGDSGTVVATR